MNGDEFYETASQDEMLRVMSTRERVEATVIPDSFRLGDLCRVIVNGFAEGSLTALDVELLTGMVGFALGADPAGDFEGCKALVAKIATVDPSLTARVVR